MAGAAGRRWDGGNGKELATTAGGASEPLCTAAAPQANLLAVVEPGPGNDLQKPRLRLLEAATGKEVRAWVLPPGQVKQVCFAADGKTLITVGRQSVTLWRTATGVGVLTLTPADLQGAEFQTAALGTTGRWLAAADRAAQVRL